MANPMEQFKIKTIAPLSAGGFDLSFTNSSLWMLIALITIAAFLFIGTADGAGPDAGVGRDFV